MEMVPSEHTAGNPLEIGLASAGVKGTIAEEMLEGRAALLEEASYHSSQ